MIYQFNISFSLSLVFMGFLLANIFGIIANSKNIIFLFVLCIELVNCFIYSYKTSKPFFLNANPNYLLGVLVFPNKIQFSRFFKSSLKQRNYKRKLKDRDNYTNYKPSMVISVISSSLNFLKIGFEFGFFIDAFKLGS